jgi:cyclophilin family peptidyl-prolyl cis-trans isomerase
MNVFKRVCVMMLAMCTMGIVALPSFAEEDKAMDNVVLMKTNKGDIKIKLNADKAPVSVQNFLTYVNEGFYDGTIFHRVITNFMIQGGGFNLDFTQKKTHDPIKNEADNGLKNTRGTIAMARTSDPDSATAQFFINLVDNSFLDFKSATPSGYGYAVFGEVIDGMDVVDAIAASRTATKDGYNDVPVEPIQITSVTVVKETAKAE